MSSTTPRLIFANTVNELMAARPTRAYAQGLWAVTPRKLWTAREGDVVVTPRAVPPAFKSYACSLLGMRPTDVTALTPAMECVELLADGVRKNGLFPSLVAEAAARPRLTMQPFALDRPTAALARELHLPILGYGPCPDDGVIDALYAVNTKSGFRRLAGELGLPLVAGRACHGTAELFDAVQALLPQTGRVIVKLDRSSNGYGHILLDDEGPDAVRQRLDRELERFPEQPQAFVVEACMPFVSVPSVEILVDDSGAHLLYLCDQRCRNGSFMGMVTPPASLSAGQRASLEHAGQVLGQRLCELGVRGICDIDGGLTEEGELYCTESNLRRTGGTYLDGLMRRLLGDDYLQSHVWIADSRPGSAPPDFAAAVEAATDAGLAFDRRTGMGVVFTCDTVDVDGRWRYLVAAETLEAAQHIEGRFERLLQLAPAN